jgi:murein DD-endopeptidase MepM/ murein hydrolase activator NlpD
VEHQWDGCPYYSLYAHLAEIVVELGAQVRQGQKLAVMGYTGRGLDRERAHLHLEVNLLINENFQTLYGVAPGPNQNAHGNFNGANLRGLDVARLYKEARANPKLTIPEFLRQEQPFFHVEIPGSMQIDMLKRYPWMAETPASEHQAPPPAWRVAFAQSGVPLKVERGSQPVSVVRVSVAQPAVHPLNQLTRGLLAGTPETAALSKSGQRFLSLLTFEPQQIAVTAAGASGEALPVTDTTHTVKRGETLLSIAKAHKMTPTELQAVNKIKDPKLLQIGQVLVIPGAGDAAAEELGGD